ncbi:DUF1161 domain-containing protein [Thalassotalea crassostreae]|uniref:DUF1161 domain-containing protein n=1 Tax=Thalassotalea crassostreae TaxID=1763536 RepID=UPI000838ADCD|nr:DUF1161 domain-containing protein [Thalassotalea crassostreae]
MKKLISLFTAALLFSVSAQAEVKDCDELEDEIHTKISNNGVENFDLMVVDNDEVDEHEGYKVVGSCEAGSQKILYKNLYKG